MRMKRLFVGSTPPHRTAIVALMFTLLVPVTALAGQVTVSFHKSKGPGDVMLRIRGAGRTQRVTVPFKLAYDLAHKARHGGGLMVSTARDGFNGNMVRLVAGQGKDAIVLDRMRRAGPNGQSGASALRLQVGLGKQPRAFFIGRTVGVRQIGAHKMIGRSGPSRLGAYPMKQGDLGLDTGAVADGKTLRWYFKGTRNITTNPKAPLVSFAPYGLPEGARPVTAKPARLIGAGAILGD